MDEELKLRLGRVVLARQEERALHAADNPLQRERQRRMAEDRRFLARLVEAVAEINDELGDELGHELGTGDLRLSLGDPPENLAAEAAVRVVLEVGGEPEMFLDLAVDPAGRVHGVLEQDRVREAFGEAPAGVLERAALLDWLTRFLERRYGPRRGS